MRTTTTIEDNPSLRNGLLGGTLYSDPDIGCRSPYTCDILCPPDIPHLRYTLTPYRNMFKFVVRNKALLHVSRLGCDSGIIPIHKTKESSTISATRSCLHGNSIECRPCTLYQYSSSSSKFITRSCRLAAMSRESVSHRLMSPFLLSSSHWE